MYYTRRQVIRIEHAAIWAGDLERLNKFNILNCMKVTGETFSFHHKRKGAEEARYQKY
jgi:hypothetical protein